MSNGKEFMIGAIVGVLSAAIPIMIMLALDPTYQDGLSEIRQEAVENGVAEWVLVSEPGPNAQFEFTWKYQKE